MARPASFEEVRLSYGDVNTDRQTVDLFKPFSADAASTRLLIFVHGGAWVSESTDMYHDMGAYIAGTGRAAVALIEYRLTSKDSTNTVWHPDHLDDVYAALQLLFDRRTAAQHRYSTEDAVLVGHSAGAWMALTIALDSHANQNSFPSSTVRSIGPLDDRICKSIKTFVCAEPIVSIVDMLQEYPSYDYFVKPAFFSPSEQEAPVDSQALQKVEVAGWPLRAGRLPVVHVVASKNDTLLSRSYTTKGVEVLRRKGIEPIVDLESYAGDHGHLLLEAPFWDHILSIL